MKMLDEVIKALEICSTQLRCDGVCPYHKSGCIEYEMEKDALHYLREYKNCKDCAYSDSYLRCTKEDSNDPLTWDELKTMEGKPVWYEHEFWKGWIILGKVEQGVNCEMIPDQEERWYIVKDGSAKAYRKERE